MFWFFREWYLKMLRKAKEQKIVVKTSNLYDLFFEVSLLVC